MKCPGRLGETPTRCNRFLLPAPVLAFLLALFSSGFLPATSAQPIPAEAGVVTIRLYGIHAEHKLKIRARKDFIFWKNCGSCAETRSGELNVEAAPEGLRLQGMKAGREVLIRGDYRMVPESGLKISAGFPLHIGASNGALLITGSVPLEEYVAAAVTGESGNFKNTESLKAMAVVVRSYAAHFRTRHASEGFDFCDSTHCQVLNFSGISAQARSAASATQGELLVFGGTAAATFYHQNCGGMLAAASEAWPDLAAPYLRRHADPYCVRATPLPWRAEFNREKLGSGLRQQGLKIPEHWDSLEIVAHTASGRALKLAFHRAAQPPQLISASSLRFAIGRAFGWNQVRSDLYEVATSGEAVVFTGRGGGHGVGMCQAGAEEMAREGKSYREILSFYFPGASLAGAPATLAWQKRESGRTQLLSTQPEQDAEILQTVEPMLSSLEAELGWKLDSKVQIKVYPSLDAYRDLAGQPGWIAAFTHGHTISLQPLAVLKQKSILESTLRHELTHMLIESRAHAATPLWFREGLALYFADSHAGAAHMPVNLNEGQIEAALRSPENRESLERAYAAARTKVNQLIERNGRETVLQWLSNGLPEER
jgi:stage II sporulation protein D